MKRNSLFLVMLGMVLAFGFVVSGCAINKATTKVPNFPKKPIELADGRQYEILGPISLEKDWSGILGFSFGGLSVIPPFDAYLYQAGGVTYVDLLGAAEEKFTNVDAVIDINVDYTGSQYWVFYAKRKNIVSGIAIRYSKAAAPSATPSLEIKLK
jgi:hypothetical protein